MRIGIDLEYKRERERGAVDAVDGIERIQDRL